ncbi:speckle-type POZ protein-like [Planococcus citri]|uniref:speckle-type POZ protein-like n=1 Tax=Planococcus citri TaxID=170843 RepID=UPI0031F7972F
MSYIDHITLSNPVSKECSHLWKINNYSAIVGKPGEKLRSEKFSAPDDNFNWCLELKVCEFAIVQFRLRPDCYDDLRKFESVTGHVEFHVEEPNLGLVMSIAEKASFTFMNDDDIDDQELDFGGTIPGISIDQIKQFISEDELLIRCQVSYFKKNEIVAIFSLNNSNSVRMAECSLLSNDMEKCFNEDRFKDVKILVKGEEFRAHKMILATRSSVFEKMLCVDMLESKKNYIDITDMEPATFKEMLRYIYTGKVKNLDELAFELLPAADRFDLEELKIMCEGVLLKKLSPDNAV